MSESDENRNPLLQGEKWIMPHSSEDRVSSDITFPKGVSKKGKLLPTRGDAANNNIISNNNNNHSKSSNNNHNIPEGYGAEYLAPEEQCGFPRCVVPPWWVQRLATKKTFLFIFCVSSVLQGMYYTYFVSVLTTIERLFQIRSQTTGVIMSATEVGQIGGGLLLSYYGGGGHRPRWIASGMLLFGFSAALCALPHFLFGDALLREFLTTAPSQDDPLTTANVCLRGAETPGPLFEPLYNATFEGGVSTPEGEECKNTNPHSRIVLGLFFVALLGVGVGQTAVYNLGIPYIDDNVASEDSPTYFGTTIGVRIFGPTFGFVLGSLCTRLSVDPFSKAKFKPTDPRWIGAWWLGHLIISFSLILTSFVMMMFPKRLPAKGRTDSARRESRLSNGNFESLHSEPFEDHSPLTEETLSLDSSSYLKSTTSNSRPSSVENIYDNRHINSLKISSSSILTPPPITEEAREKADFEAFNKGSTHDPWEPHKRKRSIKDFGNVLRRLVTNRILVLRTGSTVLHLLPISGLYTFLPKYIETQFRLPVHSAAMISGVGGILVMGFGILVSGFVIRRLNPPPRAIAGWIAITAFLYSLGMIILMFLGCSHDDVKGQVESHGSVSFEPICVSNCTDCNPDLFAPICSSEGNTYFSACHAGCRAVSFINNTEEMLFSDCECLGKDVTAKLRLCETLCPNIIWYVCVFCLFVIIHSTSEVGGMLVTLRCVSPKDKAMALGLISVAVGLFGNVPCPILYGAVVDYACIHWRQSCEGKGACQIYDPDVFRMLFHGTTALVMFLGFCVDVAVWQSCKGISFLNGNTDSNDTMASSSNHSTFLRQTVPQTEDPLTANCDDDLSTMSSTASSQRKHKDGIEKMDQTILRNGFHHNLDKDIVYDKDLNATSLQIPFDLTNYSLRESII